MIVNESHSRLINEQTIFQGLELTVLSGNNPCMYTLNYHPDIFSRNFRLTHQRVILDDGVVVNNVPHYLMPPGVLGFHSLGDKEVTADASLEEEGHSYPQTLAHERLHYHGHGEYTARFLTKDENAAWYA